MNIRLRALWASLAGAALAVSGAAALTFTAAQAAQPSDPGPANLLPSAVPSAITPAVDENGRVFGIAQTGNTMVIGGSFNTVGGLTRTKVAAFDKDTGALTGFAPNVNDDVNQVIPGPTANTVFIGGAFTQVNGTAAQFVAELDLTTGNLVPSFHPPAFNYGFVDDIVLRGNNLYVAGTFTKAAGKAHGGLVTLNATTGAVDPAMTLQFTGHHNDSGSGAQGWVGPTDIDVTADGKTLIAIGNFKYVNGLLRDQVAMVDLSGATPELAPWATDRYSPYCFNWAFDMYVRGVSFSPDGSYFVVNATGGGNAGTLCDATSRFETNLTDTHAEPTWINQTGGDTVWGVTVTDTAIYIGGHNRWENNPNGVDQPQAGAVPRAGMAALDPQTGRPFAWNPGHVPLGVSAFAFLATSDGVWMGSDFDFIGNHKYKRPKLAFFPYQGGYAAASTRVAGLPATAYLAGSTQSAAQTNVLYRVDAGGPAIQSLDSGPDWAADDSDPSPYRNSQSNAAGWDPGAAETANVPASTPNAIFNSERWSPTDSPPMDWSFPVTAGTPIEVRLYFANRYTGTGGVGQRVFNVALDGSTVLNHYDIVADVGDQTGTMKAFDINAPASGQVTLEFTHVTENPLINGIEIVRTDIAPPPPPSDNTLTTVAFDGTNATEGTAPNQGVDFDNWRGAFLVGNTVYYGETDGLLHERSFDGTTFGPASTVDPYHDPLWANVSTGDGDTFNGTFPSIYGQIPNLTGMAYADGRVYYTLFGDSHLYSRWFLPDSGIIDETTVTQSSSVDFSHAAGMFIVNGTLYYGSRSDGDLRSVAIGSDGTVSGSATVLSGPGLDGVNWNNRALFLYSHANVPPTAAFTSSCSGTSCSFDASTSSDIDGSIASYAWDFGDGQTGSGVSPTHEYAIAGTHTVTLTVTDNRGATAQVSHDVGVATTANVQFVAAADSAGGNTRSEQVTVPSAAHAGDTALLFFAQTSTSSWSGPSGVAGWTQIASYTAGTLTTTAWRKTLSAGDVGSTVSFTSAAYSHASADIAVYSGVDATNPIADAAQSGDASTALHVSPSATAGTGDYAVSYWADRAASAVTWTAPPELTARGSSPDSGGLTVQALIADSNGSVASGPYGGYTATSAPVTSRAAGWTIVLNHAGLTNQPPHAAFTADCTALDCTFDSSGSGDADGTITYAWDFGDGGTSSAAAPHHSYAAPGGYSVQLTVTDNLGATDSVTHTVSVSNSTPDVTFVGASNAGGGNKKTEAVSVPSGAQAGDTALVFLTQTSTSSWAGPSGSGWTQLDTSTQGTVTTTVWVKQLGAGDLGGTVTFTSTGYSHASVDMGVYRGVNATTPVAGFAHTGDNGGTSHTSPTLAVGTGTYVVSFWGDRASAAVNWTAPDGTVARESTPDSGTLTVQSLLADAGAIASAGTAGGLTATTDAPTGRTTMWTIALNAN